MSNAPLAALRGNAADVNRISSGLGEIRARTIEIGDTVIAVNNIGAIVVLEGKRSFVLLVVGIALILFGLMTLQNDPVQAVIGLGLGAAAVYFNLVQKIDKGLSIGTSDGRTTLIVSHNERFLAEVLEFIRRKVDTQNVSMTATFDIANAQINSGGGGVVIGDRGVAGGVGADFRQ